MSEANGKSSSKAHAAQLLTALQSEYSLMTNQPENDVIKVCEELGTGFVSYRPLIQEILNEPISSRLFYVSTLSSGSHGLR